LDGVYKSSLLGEAVAYESFVHPTMFVHNLPKRVLIFGAGAGASIREVLKHGSVEEVFVVGYDRALLKVAREHLQGWNDCSNIVGSRINCLDDPRVKMYYENPSSWLSNYISHDGDGNMNFDIAMVDLL
jgi:spermidine synthase